MFYCQTSPNLTFLLEITYAVSSGLKRRETFQHIIGVQLKSQHLWWYGVHKCIRNGQLACFGRHYECWKVYKGFRATYAALQTTSIQIKSNHFYCHITTAQVPWWVKFLWACSRQCKKNKKTIYIWTVHIYRLYRGQCAKYTYIYSVHIVYYKDILNYQLHIIHRMGTSTLCTLSIHYVVYT